VERREEGSENVFRANSYSKTLIKFVDGNFGEKIAKKNENKNVQIPLNYFDQN
jgi:hypothetical protein